MFITNKLGFVFCAASLPMLVATAQDAPAGEKMHGRPGPGGFGRGEERRIMSEFGQPSGLVFARMLSRPEFIRRLGLPEETVTKLVEGLKKIDEQERALREEIEQVRKSQMEKLATLMADRTKTGDDVREEAVNYVELKRKIFCLGVDRMLLIRDNLTDDQIKQARELVKRNFNLQREEMMRIRGKDGPEGRRRPPRGEWGKGPKPEEEKPAEPPPPPPEPEAAPEAK